MEMVDGGDVDDSGIRDGDCDGDGRGAHTRRLQKFPYEIPEPGSQKPNANTIGCMPWALALGDGAGGFHFLIHSLETTSFARTRTHTHTHTQIPAQTHRHRHWCDYCRGVMSSEGENNSVTTAAAPAVTGKLWGGRFSSAPSECMQLFNESISFDKRLCFADLKGSVAYASSIHDAGLLSDEEHRAIVSGLQMIEKEWSHGVFVICDDDEDIHSANERRLKELIGEPALKLHTGRSRNDQVNILKIGMCMGMEDGLDNVRQR